MGSLKKWSSRRLIRLQVRRQSHSSGQALAVMYPQAAHKRRKKSDCLLFQIDGGGGQIGLNAHVRDAAPDCPGKSMPALCLIIAAMKRRDFITLLGGVAVCRLRRALAESQDHPAVGCVCGR
jgi:hypothetical protein